MTSENEPRPDQQADGNPAPNQASPGGGSAAWSEPSMSDLLQAMRGQQDATAKGFADLTSGLSLFLEKMAAVAAHSASPQAKASPVADQPAAAARTAAPREAAPAEVPWPASSPATPPAAIPQAAGPGPQPQSPWAQSVTPPPVDPAAYGQMIPAAGYPQASPQTVAPSGFPAPGQPPAYPQGGFPAMHDPQVPQPQAPVAPVAQVFPAAAPVPQAIPVFPEVRQPIRAARDVARDVARGPRPAAVQVAPSPAQQPPQQPAADGRWQRILFGSDIANNQALQVLRDKVTEGLLAGDRNATGMAGTILIFNAASSDRMPQILKDVGEAYYRWNPRSAQGEDPLRNALIAWLHRKCEAAGVPNTIMVVRPGDRFEAARHNAKQQGVEVTEVGGWVVLRDNGKVYTKANVAVK